MKTNHSPIRTLIPIPQKHVPIRGYLLAFLAAAGLTPPLCWGATINVTLPPYSANNHGVGDAQPAIQSAINYAVANGHHLYFPKGVYNIERPLRITGNVGNFQISLIGDGRTADANGTIIRATRTMPQMLLHWRNKIHLYKMRFEGTQKAVNIVTSGTADYDTTSLPKIQTVTAHGSTQAAFLSEAGMRCDGVNTGYISFLTIDNCGWGVIWYGWSNYAYTNGEYSKMVVDNLAIMNSGHYSRTGHRYGYSFSRCNDFKITNDYCYNNNHPDIASLVGWSYNSVLMDGGYYEDVLRGPTAGEKCHNFTIRNYTVKDCGIGVSTDLRLPEGIPSSKFLSGQGGIIQNNNIESCSRAWFCQGDDMIFKNNYINRCPGGTHYDGHDSGVIRVNGSLRVDVQGGNTIANLNNKRIFYVTYNVSGSVPSEGSTVRVNRANNTFGPTTSTNYVHPGSTLTFY